MSTNINEDQDRQPMPINSTQLEFLYWNSYLGNDKPIKIEFDNESNILDYWIDDSPLKLITHGWLASDDNSRGVFEIKTAYVNFGGYNIITMDWSHIGKSIIYPAPAIKTEAVGCSCSEFLDRVIHLTGLNPQDIHLIGHSLGAHVVGACGSHLKTGKVGRITGLDPARPGFEICVIQDEHLNKDDAEFVDVIHTAAGTLGYIKSIGHADFYPNSGISPQPGCNLPLTFTFCSHSRSHEIYADSVSNGGLYGTKCPSWISFKTNKCSNNTVLPMGHYALPSSRGIFYARTNNKSPYSLLLSDNSSTSRRSN